MNVIGIKNWLNETGLTNYPLTSTLISDDGRQFPKNFIVDANFIQFDAFIPQLISLTVDDTLISISLRTDSGMITNTYLKSTYLGGIPFLTISLNSRYLGKLVFGDGILEVFNSFVAATMTTANAFLATTVRSIPSTAGVFSIDSLYGNLEFSSKKSLFFENTSNTVIFNAVYIPVGDPPNFLKSINQVKPNSNNSLLLLGSDTVNVNPVGLNSLIINLINSSTTNILPSTI
jgi:hypothetical protein